MKDFIFSHKIFAIIILAAVFVGGYYIYQWIFSNETSTQYITEKVQKGTLTVSVSGSGQISALNQVDVKAKTSGDITYIGVKAGQYVAAGALMAQVDTRDAQKAVRDAQASLESAQLSYDQNVGSVSGIRGIKEKNQESLEETYDNGFNAVANVFADLPTIMTGLNSILTSYDYDRNQWNLDYYADAIRLYDKDISVVRDDTYTKYQKARQAYDQNFIDYKSVSRFSDEIQIETIINQTYETSRLVSEAVKSASNLVQVYKDEMIEAGRQPKTLADTHLSNLNGYVSKANSYIQSLNSAKNNIQSAKETMAGTDFDIRTEEIQLNKAKDTLLDAQEKLAGCYVRAPFSGIVAKVNVKIGDSSSSSAVATLITKQKIAEISLNEVDVAKVAVGQKTTLVFDAIPDLTITGQVAEMDAIGTVSQGVVNYAVKIMFDTQDERVKTAMSVSVAIITDIVQDALYVSNSAVKQSDSTYYVEFLENGALRRQTVEVGLSNDTDTEIKSGVKEGDEIVKNTIISSSQTTTSSKNNNRIMIPGMGGPR